MGMQSSRIIWGKRSSHEPERLPITVYDENYTIYTYDNQCIYENKLYKCIVPETAGKVFSTEDWKEVKGVKVWKPQEVYKVGAVVIYEDFVYKCIKSGSFYTPDEYADYWTQMKQTTDVVYSPRDHKEVYYDNGRNAVKWHKMMYYLPPGDGVTEDDDIPITLYDGNGMYMYKKGDYVIHVDYVEGEEVPRLYKCNSSIPLHEPWTPGHWLIVDNVYNFEAATHYNKGDEVIYLSSENLSIQVRPFSSNLAYTAGQLVTDKINIYSEEEQQVYRSIFDQDYVNEIESGVVHYACFQLLQDIPQGTSAFYHNTAVMLPYKQYDPTYQAPSTIGDYIILAGNDYLLYKIVDAPISSGKPFEYEPVNQVHNQKQNYYLFKSLYDQIAYAFNREKWTMEYQTYTIKYAELYGVIWEKLGNSGSAGRPFYYPYVLSFEHDGTMPYLNIHVRIGSFFPYLGNNKLEPDALLMLSGAYNSSTGKYVCSSYRCGDLLVANKLQTFCYMHSYYIKDVISLVKFDANWAVLELTREADPDFGIIPTDSGFIYVSDVEQTPGYYDIYRVTLNSKSSEILNETFAFTVPVGIPSIDGEIGSLDKISRYNGFIESKMYYKDTYYLPNDPDFGWQNDPEGWTHKTGPRNYSYEAVIFDDGSVQSFSKDPYIVENVLIANFRASGRYLINELINDISSFQNVITYTAHADRSAVAAACAYWGWAISIDPDTNEMRSYSDYANIEFSGSSFWIEWKLCNKEGSKYYHIMNYNILYVNTSNVRKRCICTVIMSLSKLGANDIITVYKEFFNENESIDSAFKPYFLYNQDDAFLYCVTSDYKLGQINLQTGEYFLNGSLTNDYLIKNIPYYNNDTFHSYKISTGVYYNIKKANIRVITGDMDDYQSNYIRSVYNEEEESIDILWGIGEARKVLMSSYCDCNSGSPVLGNGAFITGETIPSGLGVPYNIAIYIPSFKSNPTNAGAFFWFSSLGWYGYPCYGGENEDGFEGW